MRRLAARHDRLKLHTPFRISRGTKTAADVVVVEIAADGIVGCGESVPYARYGESVASVLAQIEAVHAAVEDGADRANLDTMMPAGAARNAVDCALWDLAARKAGSSVAQLIGAPAPAPLATALTVVIDTPAAMGRAAAAIADAPLLKVKVDASEPAAQVRAVRAAAPHARLIVDPNEGWDRDILAAMQPVLVGCGVALLEQPVPAGDDAWLEDFDSAIPICADEAIHTVADLDVVARRYQAVNVKLDKAGGLTGALALARAARDRGLGLMTGCMISSSLSIAPALHVARISDFADLDGPLWLEDDRPGGVTARGGLLSPPARGFWGEA